MKSPGESNFVCSAGDHVIDTSSGSASDSKPDLAMLGLGLARRMRQRWRRGERPCAEEFLERHAQLRQSPEAAIDLIYEEYCQRQAAGERDVEADILRRFPQWRDPLRIMIDCHRVLEPRCVTPDFPAAGETVAGFQIVEELARGSHGRVVLAKQTELADRPVVLKITPLGGAEHLSLARLQHTNIVPVYSVIDDASRNIRMLCMPYFGRATLAMLLESLATVPFADRTGEDFVAAIDRVFDPSCEAVPAAAAARQMLAHVSYVQAACWIAASLADALEYAHEHSLVHLDVKPSNVLLAADGQPMLLDFHLAREPIRHDGPPPDRFGGTPAYMPPEQRAAMLSLATGQAIETDVDARADIYSLGATLFELLGGTLPQLKLEMDRAFVASMQAKSGSTPGDNLESTNRFKPLAEINSQVSVGLSDIVAKCLASNPTDRYPTAAALADDLRRHLADQPLAGVPNRSLAERWRKRRRREPNMFRAAGMAVIVMAAITLVIHSAWSRLDERCRQAELSLRDGQSQLERGTPAREAVASFERGLSWMNGVTIRRDLTDQLRTHLAKARRLQLGQQLHEFADRLRTVPAIDSLSHSELISLSNLCGEFWNKRQVVAESLDASHDTTVVLDLLDMSVFYADFHVQLATAAEVAAARKEAIGWLDEAEAKFGPSPVLDFYRHTFKNGAATTESVGQNELRTRRTYSVADPGQPHPDASIRRMTWERYALGRALLNSNQLDRAAREFNAARAADPAGLWPNFYYGLCAYRMGRHEEAVEAFSVCIGAAPNLAGCFYNRALALAALGRAEPASRDLKRAVELDPSLASMRLSKSHQD